MNDDAALVELAKSGDQAAFAELYERYFDRVYDFLARMVHDSSEAADLTQDAFIKAMNSLNTLTKGTSFKSWLFTIARNTALNRLERASRTQPLEGTNDAGEEQSYDVVDPDRFGNPEEAAEASSLAAVVWEAAAALDPKYRSVLMLNLREGLDSAEIADVMGVTKNHAYVLVNRMKAALESAVGAVALFRNGRRHCAELDAVIARLQIGEVTPEARRAIERHAGHCEVCQEQRGKLSSPFAIFAGMALVKPAPGIKEGILGSVQNAFSLAHGGASNAGSGNQVSSNQGQTEPQSGASSGQGGGLTGEPQSPIETPVLAQIADGGDGDGPDSPPTSAGDKEEGPRWRKRRVALVGATAAILLLIAGPLAALSFFGGSEQTIDMAVIEDTATALPTTPTKIPTTPTKTPPPTDTPTPTMTPVSTDTPTPEVTTPVPIAPGTDPGFAPGGGNPSEPAPANPGDGQPDIAPPVVSPDPDGGPQQPDPNVAPPESEPREITQVPGPDDITPVQQPCTYSMKAAPSSLLFDGRSMTQTFLLTGDACGEPLDFSAQPGSSWMYVTPSSGSIPVGGSATVAVSVDPNTRSPSTGRVVVTSAAGMLNIEIKVEWPTPTPTTGSFRQPSCGTNCISPTATPTPRGPGGFTS